METGSDVMNNYPRQIGQTVAETEPKQQAERVGALDNARSKDQVEDTVIN